MEPSTGGGRLENREPIQHPRRHDRQILPWETHQWTRRLIPCHNPDGPAGGQVRLGNIRLHRRAVADRRVTREEHQIIDETRRLIGLTEEHAEAIVREVAHEANAFFGKHPDETS